MFQVFFLLNNYLFFEVQFSLFFYFVFSIFISLNKLIFTPSFHQIYCWLSIFPLLWLLFQFFFYWKQGIKLGIFKQSLFVYVTSSYPKYETLKQVVVSQLKLPASLHKSTLSPQRVNQKGLVTKPFWFTNFDFDWLKFRVNRLEIKIDKKLWQRLF